LKDVSINYFNKQKYNLSFKNNLGEFENEKKSNIFYLKDSIMLPNQIRHKITIKKDFGRLANFSFNVDWKIEGFLGNEKNIDL